VAVVSSSRTKKHRIHRSAPSIPIDGCRITAVRPMREAISAETRGSGDGGISEPGFQKLIRRDRANRGAADIVHRGLDVVDRRCLRGGDYHKQPNYGTETRHYDRQGNQCDTVLITELWLSGPERWSHPAAIAVTPDRPAGIVVWPSKFSPHPTTVPSLLSARLW
jgi:hypothetical protein